MTDGLIQLCRVKLPKTFLAVNLSEAFTFEENERQASDNDVLEMKATTPNRLGTKSTEPDEGNGALPESSTEHVKVVNP